MVGRNQLKELDHVGPERSGSAIQAAAKWIREGADVPATVDESCRRKYLRARFSTYVIALE